ncbi:MAG: two-component sensor histidine kinase [Solirubrobacterales bacterium]|nr:two-component sensor histidine kinase [Solirubrobacterales bacterium]
MAAFETQPHGDRETADLQRSRERLVSNREEERRRLRRDLHDDLGPTIAGMAFTLDAARNLIESDPKEAGRMIEKLRKEAQEAVGDIRRVAHELRPAALDELGFVPALRSYAERMNADGDRLRVRVEAPEQFGELPAAAEVAGFRIGLEALANVARHANAHTCLVELTHRRRELRIEVADDGVGVEAGHEAGNGLASMHELAAELGGRMEVTRRKGGGTQVIAVIPTGVET